MSGSRFIEVVICAIPPLISVSLFQQMPLNIKYESLFRVLGDTRHFTRVEHQTQVQALQFGAARSPDGPTAAQPEFLIGPGPSRL